MKNTSLLFALLTIGAFAAGCGDNATTSEQMEKVKTETKAAAQDMKDYTFAQKAEFTAKMQDNLTSINADLDALAAKIEKSNDAVKAEAKPKLQALREQSAQLAKQLDVVKDSTESTWDSVKAGSRKAFDALKDGFQQSRQWLSDKIAP